MCLEIVAKKGENYILHYVPNAKCLTDPPLTLKGLIKQRRRWFNGSLFASIHVLSHMCRVWQRGRCSFMRNGFFMFLYLYLIAQMLFSFVSVGFYFAMFSIFLRSIFDYDVCLKHSLGLGIVESIFFLVLVSILLLSVSVDIQWAEIGLQINSCLMGLFALGITVLAVFYALEKTENQIGIIAIGAFF